MDKIEFLEKPELYFSSIEFIAKISKVESEDELFISLSKSLHFPSYFKNNWNALFDCLRDFQWIEKKGIVLIHTEFPSLDKEVLNIYINILVESVQDWKDGENHYLKVIFPKDSKLYFDDFFK